VLLPLLVLVPAWAVAPVPAASSPPHHAVAVEPWITATAAVLMDAGSGQVLYSHNPDLEWPPASTTKIMTALVALERASRNARIEISPQVARFREGSVVGLPQGARIPLHDLLYALLLPSGNDVALAIAEGVAGTVPAFVAQMNAEARRLGAAHTHFTSPHGLYDPDHYSTAYDLAVITRAAMQRPDFREIVHTRRWTFVPPGGHARRLTNHNRLLSRYPGADGVKTGYVHQSGQTLVASATHDGWRLIAVLLHSRDEWRDAARLLDYGFGRYKPTRLLSAGEQLVAARVPGTEGLLIGIAPESVDGVIQHGQTLQRRVSVDAPLVPPLRHGQRVGQADFYASGHLLRSVPVVAAADLEPQSHLSGVARIVTWVSRLVARLSGSSL
jgi:D-alanyl-D-alanine carboxypeptidase (penicillin-binding protein 5/6)